MKCSICGETQLPSCTNCGEELKEGDFIYCMIIGEHNHRDCMSLSKARVIK